MLKMPIDKIRSSLKCCIVSHKSEPRINKQLLNLVELTLTLRQSYEAHSCLIRFKFNPRSKTYLA